MKTLMKKNEASWKDENFKKTFLKKLNKSITVSDRHTFSVRTGE